MALTDALNGARQQVKKGQVSENTLLTLQQELQRNPKDGETHALLGQCYDILGMRELAREQYDIANKVDPGRSIGVLEHFHYYMDNGDPADAFTDWVQIRKQFPEDPQVRQYEEAIAKCFETVAAAELSYLTEREHGHNLRAVDSMLSVMAATQLKEYERALKYANFEMNKHVTPDSLFAKAFALNKLKRSDAARLIGMECFRRDSLYPGAAREYTIACLDTGHIKEAVKPAAYNLVAWDQESEIKNSEALAASIFEKIPQKELEQLLKPATDFLGTSMAAGKLNTSLFRIYTTIGRRNVAEALLTKAGLERRLDADGWYQLGQMLENKSDIQGALLAYREAAVLDPENLEKYDHAIEGLEHAALRLLNKPNDIAWKLKDALRQK